MKYPILFGAALVFASFAQASESMMQIGDRPVQVLKDQAVEGPQELSEAVQARISKEGWRDVIYSSATPEKAFLFYSQRTLKGRSITQVKVTFWKATKEAGRTVVESWVVLLDPAEVNSFLENDFSRTAMRFKSGKI